jgi:hypothetical protein
VGRGRTAFVAPGEAFEIGFGADDGLRVRRLVNDKRDTTPITGTQKIAREVGLSISNLGAAPRKLLVIERVPISEIEGLEVELPTQEGIEHDPRTGHATMRVQLAPNGTAARILAYRIEASSKILLPL